MAIKRGLLVTLVFLLTGGFVLYLIGTFASEVCDVHLFFLIWLCATVFAGGTACGIHTLPGHTIRKGLHYGIILMVIALGLLLWFLPILWEFQLLIRLAAVILLLSVTGALFGHNLVQARRDILGGLKKGQKTEEEKPENDKDDEEKTKDDPK